MRMSATLVALVGAAAGVVGGVSTYTSSATVTAAPDHTGSPVLAVGRPLPAAPARVVKEKADCTAPAVLQDGVCVTTVQKVAPAAPVEPPAPAPAAPRAVKAPAPAPAAAPQPAAAAPALAPTCDDDDGDGDGDGDTTATRRPLRRRPQRHTAAATAGRTSRTTRSRL